MFDIDKISKKNVVSLFREQVQKTPNKMAICCNDNKYTYHDVNTISEKIAYALLKKGINRGDIVPILLPRNEYIAIAPIGVLKTGAAFLPLNIEYPIETIKYMVFEVQSKIILTSKSVYKDLSFFNGNIIYIEDIYEIEDTKELEIEPNENDLFAILFTSGTTGKPKAIMLEHVNILYFLNFYINEFNLGNDTRQASYANFSFDANLEEIYGNLLSGSELYIVNDDERKDVRKLDDYCIKNNITILDLTTQVGLLYMDICKCKSLKYLILGGEAVPPIKTDKTFTIYNTYGPSECTVSVYYFKIDKYYDNVPIGKQQPNVKSYIVDDNMKEVGPNEEGELLIAGPQVARGYYNNIEKTNESFIENPFCKDELYKRVYRTGDIVKKNPDGNVIFVGRRDEQIKIHGFRIEIAEIRCFLRESKDIDDAVVIVHEEQSGKKILVAYVVSKVKVDLQELKNYIKKNMPIYMVPEYIMQIDEIPLNANGKLDKNKLPRIISTESRNIVLPKGEKESILYECAKKVLNNDDFGVTDDLYMHGLDSITSMKYVLSLPSKYAIRASDIMRYRNIRDIVNGKSRICYWFGSYDSKKPVMVLILGIVEFSDMFKKCRIWSREYNVLVIEDIINHYDKIFLDEPLSEVVAMYNTLIEMNIKNNKIKVAMGFSWGGELAHRMMNEWSKKYGYYPTVIIGDEVITKKVNEKYIVNEHDIPLNALDKFDNDISKEIAYFQKKFDIINNVEYSEYKNKGNLTIYPYNGDVIYLYCLKRKANDTSNSIDEWKKVCHNFHLINLDVNHEDMITQDEFLPFYKNLLHKVLIGEYNDIQ